MSLPAMSRAELAGYLCSALESEGIQVVLTGGSCVSIYSEEAYVSRDIDFVDVSYASGRKIKQVLKALGFMPPTAGRRYYEHADCEYSVEFSSAPLAIGSQQIPFDETAELQTGKGALRLLSPTDCVKDRLSHYCHWHDLQGMEQALLVARRQPVDLVKIRRWLVSEGFEYVDREFRQRLSGAGSL